MFIGRTNLKKKPLVLANKCHRATVVSGINFLSAWFRTALTSNSIVVAGGVELAVPEKYLSDQPVTAIQDMRTAGLIKCIVWSSLVSYGSYLPYLS